MERASIDGGVRQVAYLESGRRDGRVAVLLHAFPLSSAMWHPQLAGPPWGWRFVAPDLAGFGESDDRVTDAVRLEDYAEDVVALLDVLSVERAVVVGVSLGGYIALAMARHHASRLAGMVLADTKAPADTPEARTGRARLLEVLRHRGSPGVADDMLPKLLGPTTFRDRGAVVAEARRLIENNEPAGLRRAILRLRDRPDATAGLAHVTVPTLVVVGDEDAVTPRAEAERLAQGIPEARMAIIPSAGHLSSLERPDAFNAMLGEFLGRL